ncbi:biotin carboxylase N-terminal domain-containing protein [Blastococcus sp. Marseille-P5729]|uniref:acetyl/propionyl/methylcrotonyl-CoA carboxylase subunit alpha n=1 Tax=Blastococcus sp. Marseille-P5729 TaxID=2086582 RepID=UPI00131EC316|nr:biotin carboxylase N-terminal domain-containing protein [Blastococcus sp. Marseille-P5729]
MTRISCILVANRGEIVSRVARTASRLGVRTVGVYSSSDADSRYLDDVDLAVSLGDDSQSSPYLSIENIIDACRRTGADAVHPGYGFLAENAEFARAVGEAGLIWIGPTPEAIDAMGGKIGAKQIAAEAGVPVLDSVTVGEDVAASIDDIKALQPPLLVKPSAGGGGKGMVRLDSHDGLERALETARRGAESAFGDGTLFVERYLEGPRHVEVQILGDTRGSVVHLGTRDCSVQRRHQKIIEEAPAPDTNPVELARQICDSAVALAKQIGYVGAGTVEFLAFDGGYAFLEMNTRLQVEHAVTEEVTGVDLVEQQIRIAEGAPLTPWVGGADELIAGHSIEARVYAEDPARDYLPSPGLITHWSAPELEGVRWEIGVRSGSEVSVRFDPMIAKAVATADDRPTAIALLRKALSAVEVAGISTNIPQLLAILDDDEFVGTAVGTDFLERRAELVGSDADAEDVRLAAVAAALQSLLHKPTGPVVQAFAPVGFRNLRSQPVQTHFTHTSGDLQVDLTPERDGTWTWQDGETARPVRVARLEDDRIAIEVDGMRRSFAITAGDPTLVGTPRGVISLHPVAADGSDDAEGIAGSVEAPLPGLVVAIEVEVGDKVGADQTLVVLEAMKMEHKLTAGGPGVVKEILVGVGDSVDYQAALVVVEEDES